MPTMFDIEPIAVVKQAHTSTKDMMMSHSVNNTFDHMAYGINKAYLAGESIIKNRNNSI